MFTGDFLAPGRLWFLLIVAALAIGYVASTLYRQRAALRFTQVELLDSLAPKRPGWRRHVVAGVQLVSLAAAVVAMAQPVRRDTIFPESGGQIMLLFDVSWSMEATDVQPTRLEAAQEQAKTFVDRVRDDVEVGLISFSGVVRTAEEPTLNRTQVENAIDNLQLADSTAIGDALAAGTSELIAGANADGNGDGDGGDTDGETTDDTSSEDEKPPGVIVLLTDGETTIGQPTERGAQQAADADIPVFTIAFGTPGGTIEDPYSGETMPVPIRPEPLEQVAEATGGESFVAESGSELSDAYERIDDLLQDTIGEPEEVIAEQTWKWAAAAVITFAIGWLLSLWLLRGIL